MLARIIRDVSASFVVFLVAMPLCMGIAIASGVPPERGLISGIVGGVVVGVLSGSPLQISGPAAGLVVMVFDIVQTRGVSALGPILLLSGAFQCLAAMLRLGRWFQRDLTGSRARHVGQHWRADHRQSSTRLA